MANTEQATTQLLQSSSEAITDDKQPKPMKPPTSQLADRFGNKLIFGNVGDYWHPPLPIVGADSECDYRSHVRAIRDMEIRDDDILICSFPKTGLHWHGEMLTQLRNKSSELNPEDPDTNFLDNMHTSIIDKRPSPRIMETHVPFRYIPKQALEKKIKILYLVRNPKDVLVSFYNHLHSMGGDPNYDGTFEQFFHLYLECGYYYGDIFDYFMEWQNGMKAHPNMRVHVSVYEEMKKDPIGGVKKLNEFLNFGCSPQLCEDIAVSCGFKKLKDFKDKTMGAEMQARFKNEATAGFYRKGQIGDWKNWFTVSMNELYDKEYKKRMADYDIQFTYTQ